MQGEYGLSDLCISVPAIVGDDGVRQVLEIPLNEKENKELRHSANGLKEILQKIWL
jgi:L-lactate dehydrogenase